MSTLKIQKQRYVPKTSTKLGEYDFQIEYIIGKENRVADFLSTIENVKHENNLKDTI